MSSWHLAWQPLPSVSVYECACEWVILTSVVKSFEWSVDWKSVIEMQVHLPFTVKLKVSVIISVEVRLDCAQRHSSTESGCRCVALSIVVSSMTMCFKKVTKAKFKDKRPYKENLYILNGEGKKTLYK